MSDSYPAMRGPNGKTWDVAGPKAAAYGLARGPLAVCIGPTGGGKTTESFRRIIRIAQWQHPSPRDGIRKARILVLGTTYRRLWDQAMNSYRKEISTGWGKFTGAKGDPADHVFDVEWQGFGRCHIEVLFRAVGDADLEEFFQGFEVTAVHIPEMSTWDTGDVLSKAANRVGRYPEPDDRPELSAGLPAAYAGVYGDANAPEIGTWFHERFYLKPRPDDQVFIQPPGYDPTTPDGFHPQAENAHNLRKLDRQYYITRAKQHEEWDVKRLLENRPGYSRHGQPVHPHFDAERMVVHAGIEPDPDTPLVIGVDAGSNTLRHSGGFLQRTYTGQVRLLGEVTPDGQSDIMEFCRELRRLRETRFARVREAVIYVDPAAKGQSAMRRGVTWAQVIAVQTGIETRLAPSQDPAVRRSALDQVLKRSAGPGEPGFIVSGPHCPKHIAALAGGYRFARRGDKLSLTPEKNEHSHPAEDTHYGVLGLEGVPGLASGHNPSEPDRADHGGSDLPLLQD